MDDISSLLKLSLTDKFEFKNYYYSMQEDDKLIFLRHVKSISSTLVKMLSNMKLSLNLVDEDLSNIAFNNYLDEGYSYIIKKGCKEFKKDLTYNNLNELDNVDNGGNISNLNKVGNLDEISNRGNVVKSYNNKTVNFEGDIIDELLIILHRLKNTFTNKPRDLVLDNFENIEISSIIFHSHNDI